MALRHHLLTGLAIASLTLSCKDKPADNAGDGAPTAPPAVSSVAPLAVAPPAMSASAMPETAAADPHGRGHGGPGAMLFAAARKLDLKDDQKAKIDAAEKAAHGGGPDGGDGGGDGGGGGMGTGGGGGGGGGTDTMKEAVKSLHTELIAEIKAGKIESAKLEPKYAAVEKVSAAGHEKEAVALNGLYAALEPAQRKAVAADVRAKQAAREAKMAERMAASDAGADGGLDGGKGAGGWMAKRALEHLTGGLDLDADQQKKVDAIVAKEDAAAKPRPDMAEMKKNVESLLAAFEKDGFDAKKQAAFSAKNARAPMEQEAKLLAQLVPILKPEQREKLAAKMEKPPSPMRRQGPGMGHRPLLEQDEDDD